MILIHLRPGGTNVSPEELSTPLSHAAAAELYADFSMDRQAQQLFQSANSRCAEIAEKSLDNHKMQSYKDHASGGQFTCEIAIRYYVFLLARKQEKKAISTLAINGCSL